MIEVAVDEVLAGGTTGNCMLDVTEVLGEEMSEDVDIAEVLVAKGLEKVESCVVNKFGVLVEEKLKAERFDRETVFRVVGLRVMEGTIGS